MTNRLDQQMRFLVEVDKLKSVTRATTLCDASRRENSAEHSWHLALYAMVLADAAPADVDQTLLIKMLILHDIVEIDAGDVPIFGAVDAAEMAQTEKAAANRIFGLLPDDQRDEFLAIWREFEANETPTARFAKSIDRFQPPNQNLASGGGSWVEYKVDYDTVATRVGAKIAQGAPHLWDWISPKIRRFFDDQSRP